MWDARGNRNDYQYLRNGSTPPYVFGGVSSSKPERSDARRGSLRGKPNGEPIDKDVYVVGIRKMIVADLFRYLSAFLGSVFVLLLLISAGMLDVIKEEIMNGQLFEFNTLKNIFLILSLVGIAIYFPVKFVRKYAKIEQNNNKMIKSHRNSPPKWDKNSGNYV